MSENGQKHLVFVPLREYQKFVKFYKNQGPPLRFATPGAPGKKSLSNDINIDDFCQYFSKIYILYYFLMISKITKIIVLYHINAFIYDPYNLCYNCNICYKVVTCFPTFNVLRTSSIIRSFNSPKK